MMTEARDGICRRHSGELLLQRWFGQRGSCHVCCCRHVDISCRMLRHARGLLAFSTVLISLLIALWRGPALAGRITRYTPSVCLYVCLSVCPAPTVSSKTENRTTFKLRGEVIQVTSNWQSNFKIKSSKVKVTWRRKKWGSHIAHWVHTDLLFVQVTRLLCCALRWPQDCYNYHRINVLLILLLPFGE